MQRNFSILYVFLFIGIFACGDSPPNSTGKVPEVPQLLRSMYAQMEERLKEESSKPTHSDSMAEVAGYIQILVVNGKLREAEDNLERLRKSEKTAVALKMAEEFIREAKKAPDFQALNNLYIAANKEIVALLGSEVQQRFAGIAAELEDGGIETPVRRPHASTVGLPDVVAGKIAKPIDSVLGARLNRAVYGPHFVNGKPVAFKVMGLKDRYLLQRGLRSGDIIFAVAGVPVLADSGILETAHLKPLWNEGAVTLDVSRGGSRQELVLPPLKLSPELDRDLKLEVVSTSVSLQSVNDPGALAALPKSSRTTPYYKDGVIVGVRVFAISAASPLLKIGLVNGDRIEKLNGKVTKDAKVVLSELVDAINSGLPVELEFIRDSVPHKITLS